MEAAQLRYGASTRLSPERIIDKAVEYFGGLGLEVSDRTPSSVCMVGGGGEVTVNVCGGEETEVEIITTEWDHHVRMFIQRIGE